MPDQCYFTDGHFYQCATATAAGETPVTNPAKWRKVRIPKAWRWMLTRLTQAHLLDLDGQTEKAALKRQEALSTDGVGLDDVVRQAANTEIADPRASMNN